MAFARSSYVSRCAANRARANACDSRHDAYCFFDWSRDGEEHLPRAERRSFTDDQDSWKRELGIYRRRQAESCVYATGTKQRDDEINKATLSGEEIEERSHYLTCTTLTLSSKP